jgi:hypothetical protein
MVIENGHAVRALKLYSNTTAHSQHVHLTFIKGTVSRKSWRDKAMVSKSRLQLRIATGFKIFLIGPLIPVMFQSFHFA